MNCFPGGMFVLLRLGSMATWDGGAGQLGVWCFSRQLCVMVSWGAQITSHFNSVQNNCQLPRVLTGY